jgi:hypothetical protein
MALNPKLSAASRDLALNAALDVLNSGFFDIYDGTQPTDADTAVGAQVKLARLTFASTAYGASSSGTKTAGAIGSDASADATGTASWYRQWRSNGTTAVWDGSVGTSGANLNLNSVAIQSGAQVSISAFTATMAV